MTYQYKTSGEMLAEMLEKMQKDRDLLSIEEEIEPDTI